MNVCPLMHAASFLVALNGLCDSGPMGIVEFGFNRMMAPRQYSAALSDRRRRPNPEPLGLVDGLSETSGSFVGTRIQIGVRGTSREVAGRPRGRSSRPEQIMPLMHDEQIVVIRNASTLQCGEAIYFGWSEMLERTQLRKVQPLRSRTSR
jgi:hypothetical protein